MTAGLRLAEVLATPRRHPAFTSERLLGVMTGAPNAFWRFDVDVSLAAAAGMARFAQVAGISGTFYLNPRCEFYNLFSREGQTALRIIADAGHQLGLHCDAQADRTPLWSVERDLKLLRAEGVRVGVVPRVSFHMPTDAVLWKDFTSFSNAYASRWKGRYVSDSRGRPIEREVTDDLQVCLHPEHWRL